MVTMRFGHILRKREVAVTLTRENESLNNGRLQSSEPTTYNIDLVVLPLTAEDIEQYEGGTYSTQDKKIFAREDLDVIPQKGDIITHNNEDYEIRERTSWLDYADFETFVAKKVVVE